MSIPLVQKPEKDDINTSIIAIKRNIERINMLLGLVDSGSDPDLSGLATKQELQDAVTELTPVDEVTSGNMHSVTSNAVAEALSYSTEEVDTGTYFGGKKVYKRSYYITSLISGAGSKYYSTGITGVDMMLKFNTIIKRSNGDIFEIPYININAGNYYIINYLDNSGNLTIVTSGNEEGAKIIATFLYTKTT